MNGEKFSAIVLGEFKKSLIAAVWFMGLTFPLMVIKVNTIEKTIEWRWINMAVIGIGAFFLSILWRYLLARKETIREKTEMGETGQKPIFQRFTEIQYVRISVLIVVTAFALSYPLVFNAYQTSIVITALIYVMLGLGLNIVVGVAGLLDLGYVAFYAVGAYSYALLNLHWPNIFFFWDMLPIAAMLAAITGILLGFPVLRLRGDYLAIVTLGFGEIIRLILQNWSAVTYGPRGIKNIPRPGFFGMDMDLSQAITYLYYLMIVLVIFTIFIVNRLHNSRLGRAWLALREDEIACQAMGIDKHRTKLTAFALGAMWAGFAGVIFAAKTTFVNPSSFTFMESAFILSIVVLGGMGSITGVILGALVITLVPEYLRDFGEYRMLIFGALMVLMMVFRPGGMVQRVQRHYEFHAEGETAPEEFPSHG